MEKKKIAVVLPTCSVGGAKYLYLLLQAILKLKPNYQIKLWHDFKNDYAKDLIIDKLSPLGVEFKVFNSRNSAKNFFSKLQSLIKVKNSFKDVSKKELKDFDLLFCPWPYDFNCPKVDIPMICVPHDFNYTHHFGLPVYSNEQASMLKMQHKVWFDKTTPIVSTNFMARELRNVFPELKKEIPVIHLSALNDFEKLEDNSVNKILTGFGVNFEYVLCANNTCSHKNFNLLYGGYYYLKQKYPNIKLVLVGPGTARFNGKSNSATYIDWFSKEKDVVGLGMVSDEVLTALMQRAKLVINPSLYEAGNGSGLDAWGLGVPVAMSDIEPFREQMETLGVRAQTFDPQNAKDIVNAMIRVIENTEETKENVKKSREAIKNYGWDKIAQKYIDVFEKVMKEKKS